MSFNSNPLFTDSLQTTQIQLVYPRGFDHLVASEIAGCGLQTDQLLRTRAVSHATLGQIYWLLMYSRLVSRVLINLAVDNKTTQVSALSEAAASIDWVRLLEPDSPFWIDAKGQDGDIRSAGFGAQLIKDAIVDAFRAAGEAPPYLDRDNARQVIAAGFGRGFSIALDCSRRSLHQRGYRNAQGAAPVKEHLAAAVLMRAGWPEMVAADPAASMLDPFCGSGTILIEAAHMAIQQAPGLLRETGLFRYARWHEPELWQAVIVDATAQAAAARQRWTGRCLGRDVDPKALTHASINIRSADVVEFIDLERRSASEAMSAPEASAYGLIATNPPYGERLGSTLEIQRLYADWATALKQLKHDCRLAVLSGLPDVPQVMHLKPKKQYQLYNGDLEVVLSVFELYGGPKADRNGTTDAQPIDRSPHQDDFTENLAMPSGQGVSPETWSEHQQTLANRLRKNLKQLRKWAGRNDVSCYRLYDADIPEFAFALDWYEGEVSLQEYAAPKSVDPVKARQRLIAARAVISSVLELDESRVVIKQRSRQRGNSQYEKAGRSGPSPLSRPPGQSSLPAPFRIVQEAGMRVYVNLHDYLDTGLFLDHRPARAWLREQAKGKRVLNLFSYTAVASLQAAAGGAAETLSVDMSQTYLNWAIHNFGLNGLNSGQHRFLQADVMEWLSSSETKRERFDLIFLDPPSFSNSKRMTGVLDIQRDHEDMIRASMQRLEDGGTLLFSSNLRSFKLSPALKEAFEVTDFTKQSIPEDFARNPRIHSCWLIRTRT
ncbi:bifunctional 23S rRNA (guanine(2069)-N(7))-methyltransferase RlmK/23S rRNA (guanine(2445)-N(2))-methyltransferase RlmL [Allohahella marinimesophila]|uniref:Ribosomal RNA large subunit methyltransferase K/L n=1 Tax=Allohahella marinimesophila TaxID=1054972 RepID=A0ABP7NND0_9GAMM